MINSLFYKYVALSHIDSHREAHKTICEELGLKGKVLVSEEGLNGNVTGSKDAVETYEAWITSQDEFVDMEFKHGPTDKHNFTRIVVKLRDEIITTHHDEDRTLINDRAPHLAPEEFKQKIEHDDDLIIVDARNTYEYNEGHFDGAIHLGLDKFSEWFDKTNELQPFKDKTIVTYCTGGIRCEKASAALKRKGFQNVYQLHGGILKYGEVIGDDYWVKDCFVFDQRHAVPIDPAKQGNDTSKIEAYEPYAEKK